jgi:hypothetical protein
MEIEKVITHWDEENQIGHIKLIGEFDDKIQKLRWYPLCHKLLLKVRW